MVVETASGIASKRYRREEEEELPDPFDVDDEYRPLRSNISLMSFPLHASNFTVMKIGV